ncbi:MAG: GTPase, partial [bacterium]|nr:GTPase [bacterium]
AVTLVQMDMLKQLCNLHDKDFSASEGKTILTALTGAAIARMGASLVKAIPGVGTLLGGASMSIMSGASTYAVARVAILHFESGGNLFDLDMDKAKEIYKDTLDKGKKYASDLDKERKKKKGESDDIFEKLEKLAVMKEKGIVSEKEFDDQKEKLLERL